MRSGWFLFAAELSETARVLRRIPYDVCVASEGEDARFEILLAGCCFVGSYDWTGWFWAGLCPERFWERSVGERTEEGDE